MYTRIINGFESMPFRYAEFLCDSSDDVKSLPTNKKRDFNGKCAIGSTAFVVDTSKKYILNNSGVWEQKQTVNMISI